MNKLFTLLATSKQLSDLCEHGASSGFGDLTSHAVARIAYDKQWQSQAAMTKKNVVENMFDVAHWTGLAKQSALVQPQVSAYGVTICSLADDYDSVGDQKAGEQSLLSLFIDAVWQVGLLINVPARTVVQQPINFNDYLVGDYLSVSKIVVRIADDAQVTFIDQIDCHQKVGGAARSVTYILGNRARVVVVHEQDWSLRTVGFMHMRATLAADSFFDYQAVVTGGNALGYEFDVCCADVRSQARVNGAIIGRQEQFVAVQSHQTHAARATVSSVDVRGVCNDAAQINFEGAVLIQQSAFGSDADQQSKFLIIGPKARAYAKPVLEALADDIRCSHGSAIGQLDAAQLTYLNMRGVDDVHAQQLLVQGFLSEVVAAPLQPFLQQAITVGNNA